MKKFQVKFNIYIILMLDCYEIIQSFKTIEIFISLFNQFMLFYDTQDDDGE